MEANVIMFLIGLMLGIIIMGYAMAGALAKAYRTLRAKNSLIAKLRRQR